MSRHSPVDLVLLLQIFYMSYRDILEPKVDSEARRKSIEKWKKAGMIEPNPDHIKQTYRTTEKGQFFIRYLCDIRLPIQESSFHIPNPKENDL